VYWRARVDAKPVSRFKDFSGYAESKREADKIVRGLVKGSQAATLSPGQAGAPRFVRHWSLGRSFDLELFGEATAGIGDPRF
jgi:hypothetical protein